jgi:hypothetical protein
MTLGMTRQTVFLCCWLLFGACNRWKPSQPLAASEPPPSALFTSSTPAPPGALASAPCAQTSFDTLASTLNAAAQPVGSVLLDSVELALATEPGAAPNRRGGGAPALVVGQAAREGVRYLRVLAADHSSGWTTFSGGTLEARAVFPDGKASISSAPVAVDAPSAEDTVEHTLETSAALVVGASDRAAREFMWQLGQGDYFDDVGVPWLRIAAGTHSGFLSPSETRLVWSAAGGAPCDAAELRGLVRASFLTRALPKLLQRTPREGQLVTRLSAPEGEPWPAAARCSGVDAAIYAHATASLIAFDCEHPTHGKLTILRMGGAGNEARFYLVDPELRLRVVRHAQLDLGGNGGSLLVVQVGQQSSHEYSTGLVVARGATARYVPLAGPTEAAPWVAGTGPELLVARVSAGGVEPRVLDLSAVEPREAPGFLAVLGEYHTLLEAERAAFAQPGSLAFPLQFPARGWAVGVVFRDISAACARARSRVLPPTAKCDSKR